MGVRKPEMKKGIAEGVEQQCAVQVWQMTQTILPELFEKCRRLCDHANTYHALALNCCGL